MAKLTTNGWTTREALMDRVPFTTYGALSAIGGSNGMGYSAGTGQLPVPWAMQYRADSARIVYTVMSYQTPIAWVLDDNTVVIPRELSGRNAGQPVKYSITTSGHQGMLYALDVARLPFPTRAAIREGAERERQAVRDRRMTSLARGIDPVRRTPLAIPANNDWYASPDSASFSASDYDALIAEVGELSRPVR